MFVGGDVANAAVGLDGDERRRRVVVVDERGRQSRNFGGLNFLRQQAGVFGGAEFLLHLRSSGGRSGTIDRSIGLSRGNDMFSAVGRDGSGHRGIRGSGRALLQLGLLCRFSRIAHFFPVGPNLRLQAIAVLHEIRMILCNEKKTTNKVLVWMSQSINQSTD